jgi:hypothetical protein
MWNEDEFEEIVGAVVARFAEQNSQPIPALDERLHFAAQLRQLIEERGLPRPSAPGSMADEDWAALVARVAASTHSPLLSEAGRQLVKACFYPELKVCRDSFRECAGDGSCRRQELERVRRRISGAHCVDCPHWVGLDAEQHAEYLQREWRGDARVFAAHREVFLPEDFRALRRWLHAAARIEARRA